MSQEHRRHTRVACTLLGSIAGSAARVVDLSEGGARLSSEARVSVGQIVRISVSFPGRLFRLRLRARVVHTSADSIGVAFDRISARAIRVLHVELHKLAEELSPSVAPVKEMR